LRILIKELKERIHNDFLSAFRAINEKFDHFFRLMFKGGRAKMKIQKSTPTRGRGSDQGVGETNNENENNKEEQEEKIGVEIDLNLPDKKITGIETLSGGEKSLVSIAALFALISVSPPPFLVLDEIDAALDEKNSQMFANLVKDFSGDTQFIIVTHNRAVMEAADVLYGITMNEDGTSKLLSLKLEGAS
jgi:chromosome segregation protein